MFLTEAQPHPNSSYPSGSDRFVMVPPSPVGGEGLGVRDAASQKKEIEVVGRILINSLDKLMY